MKQLNQFLQLALVLIVPAIASVALGEEQSAGPTEKPVKQPVKQPVEQPAEPAIEKPAEETQKPKATEEPAETAPVPVAKVQPKIVSLDVYPPEITLNHSEDKQHVIAVATLDDGVTRDVTTEVNWQFTSAEADQGAVAINEGLVTATRNGLAQLDVKLGELGAKADIHATGIEKTKEISFRHDVMPVFLRAGCNAGGCHGASRGKDGFRLSLFGYDPAGDHHRLTRELIGRRVNLALPEESLLLTKAVASVPHSGGKRFEPGSVYYSKIKQWIDKAAPNDVEDAPSVDALRLYPPKAALESGGKTQQFVAVADYSDGTSRDVTHLVVFQSSDAGSAAVDLDGLVTSGRRGEAFVMARFDTHTVGSQVLSLPAESDYAPPVEDDQLGDIDQLVNNKLRTMRILPSELAGDEEFLRRVTLDIAGQLPTSAEREAFLGDEDPAKRPAKIDELLARPAFADLWAKKWADLLLVRTEVNRVEYKGMYRYWEWLRNQVRDGVPLDQMVHGLLTASGTTFDSPATNFYQIEPNSLKTAENVAQSLLGLRVQCAQCHNHPFDRWTMDDYYGFTAFFTQIGRKRAEDWREHIVFDRRSGEARHPVGNAVVKPKLLGDEVPDIAGRDRREVVADWITSPENPYFAPSIANRVWAHFFGTGIVEPIDDIRVSNPPSNPELFDLLGEKLVEYGFDMKPLVRDICNSQAYQRSSLTNESNEGDMRNFARHMPRRIPAEMLLDAISTATGAEERLPGLPPGARAVEIADGRAPHYFLKTFGRSQRSTVCACETDAQPTLSQALHMLNGSTTNQKIKSGKLVSKWLDDGKSANEVIDRIYARSLSRLPTEEERNEYAPLLAEKEKPVAELEDIFWAVLNSREFLFNH